MIKKLLHISFFICLFTSVNAQPYGNEWIDYSKPYYKFKIGKTSLYRIPYSVLSSLGIPASQIKGTDFKLLNQTLIEVRR